MIIGKYVRQLLEEGKRVILPGFGNLEMKETGGRVPTSRNRIEPPGISVMFNSGFSKDDGQLSMAYASGEGLDEEEARQRVLELVDAIKFALDKGEAFRLPEAGTFRRDEDGRVHFSAEPGWVISTEQYGLEAMDILELEDLPDEETESEKKPEPEPVRIPDPVVTTPSGQRKPAASSGPVKPWERKDTQNSLRRTKRWRVIWILAGLLIVFLVVLIIVPVDFFRRPEGPLSPRIERPQGDPLPGSEGMEQSPEIDDSPEASDEEGQSAQTEQNAGDAAEEPSTPEVTPGYYIIAGSFKNLANASELQDRLKAMGYTAEVMITENRMYRVSVASFASKGEAQERLEALKNHPNLESCWLLSN